MSKLMNLANWDRTARVIVGALLAGAGLFTALVPAPWNWIVAGLGLVFLVTGLVGVCPLYMLFRFQTLKKA